MGYGVTSSSLLISLGAYPVVASASIHTSELFVSLVSGVSHFKFGNIKKDLLWPLISFGILGGIIGALGLIKLPLEPVKSIVALILFCLGGVIVYRFIFRYKTEAKTRAYSKNKLRALGFFAAIIDAVGGGGWGPICTPTLIINGTEPSKAVGSVNLAEFFVTLAMSLTFLIFMRIENFRWDIVLALLAGGIAAAPLAAYFCRRLPRRILGTIVGLMVMLLSLNILIR